MKRVLTSLIAGASMMLPAAALADHHTEWDYDMTTYDTEEKCEEALAEQRRMMTMGVRGRDRGQFNKDFNQRYQCVESEDGDEWMIDDRDS